MEYLFNVSKKKLSIFIDAEAKTTVLKMKEIIEGF